MTDVQEAAERVQAFVEAFARLHDTGGKVHEAWTDPESDEPKVLHLADLRALLAAVPPTRLGGDVAGARRHLIGASVHYADCRRVVHDVACDCAATADVAFILAAVPPPVPDTDGAEPRLFAIPGHCIDIDGACWHPDGFGTCRDHQAGPPCCGYESASPPAAPVSDVQEAAMRVVIVHLKDATVEVHKAGCQHLRRLKYEAMYTAVPPPVPDTDGAAWAWNGTDRTGNGRTGRGPLDDVRAFVEARFNAGWRTLLVRAVGEDGAVVGVITHDADGRRMWWVDSTAGRSPAEVQAKLDEAYAHILLRLEIGKTYGAPGTPENPLSGKEGNADE